MPEPSSLNSIEPTKNPRGRISDATPQDTVGDLFSFSVFDWIELGGKLADEPAESGLLLEKSIKKAFEATSATKEGYARLYLIGIALTRAGVWQPQVCDFYRLGQSLKEQDSAKVTCFLVGLPDVDESNVRVAIWMAYLQAKGI